MTAPAGIHVLLLNLLAAAVTAIPRVSSNDAHHTASGSSQAHAFVAACVLAKNEHLHIREFIRYHHWIGIDKFYIWDHQSRPPLAYVLEDYVLSDLVEVMYFSNSWKKDELLHKEMYTSQKRAFLSPQGWAYDNCYRCVGFPALRVRFTVEPGL